MAASLLALVRGIAIAADTIFQKTLAHGVVLQTPFGKQVSVSGEDYLYVAELCVSELSDALNAGFCQCLQKIPPS